MVTTHIRQESSPDRRLSTWRIAVIAGSAVLLWSLLFLETFQYSFYWDDLHFIRPYSWAEILTTFHGWNDPDHLETPALRPVATLIFDLQSLAFDDHMVLHRAAMIGLMGGLLWSVGLLLREVRLDQRHIVIVAALFTVSRTFAAVALWITLGSLIVCYIAMALASVCYLRWMSRQDNRYLLSAFVLAGVAVFSREEAYMLAFLLPIVWGLSSTSHKDWRRALKGAAAVASVLAMHAVMRRRFVPEAPVLEFSRHHLHQMAIVAASAAMPGGYTLNGGLDIILGSVWAAFLVWLLVVLARTGSARSLAVCAGICALGGLLCAPAMAVARPFGTTLPALAFATAVAFAAVEVRSHVPLMRQGRRVWVNGLLVCGLAIGIVGGLRRSTYLAETFHPNAATKLNRDGSILLGRYGHATVPAPRREAGMKRLAAFGIHSVGDLDRLRQRVWDGDEELARNRAAHAPLFADTYPYLSY